MKKMMKGFTLVEIMIVVAIIAILAAVAIPQFSKYRKNSQANACISNLKQIQTAKEQLAMAGKELSAANLYGSTGLIKVTPTCPSDKSAYTIGGADEDPTCTSANAADEDYPHKLPTEAEAESGT